MSNFLSVREKAVLDLRIPGTTPDHPRFRRSQARPDLRVPAVAILTGPNGSGKTTMLVALVRMLQIASSDLGDTEAIESVLPFMSRQCHNEPTRFSIDLEADWLSPDETPTAFRYVIETKRSADAKDELTFETVTNADVLVEYEALIHFPRGRPRRLLERRSGERIYVSPEFGLRPHDQLLDRVRRDVSTLSTLSALNVPLAERIVEHFAGYLHSTNLDSRGRLDGPQLFTMMAAHPGLMDRVGKELRGSDLGIQNVRMMDGPGGKLPWFDHAGVGASIPLFMESRGTQRLLQLLPQIDLALDATQLAVFDEMDADLHVDIVDDLIHKFRSQETNPSGAQLLLTSHNLGLLEGSEKEEHYVVEKDRNGATQIHGAKDVLGLRRDASLYRKYRVGALGGVPNIG